MCTDCRKQLGGISGLPVVNEIGRKNCYGCGDDGDDLESFDVGDNIGAFLNGKKIVPFSKPNIEKLLKFVKYISDEGFWSKKTDKEFLLKLLDEHCTEAQLLLKELKTIGVNNV